MKPTLRFATLALLAATPAHATVTMDWVTVGNAGNAPDPLTGHGAVGYEYRIGTHEVTNAQYASFLNSVAAADPNGLYNTFMGSDPRGGILRSGASGNYSYTVRAGMANKPVTHTDWFDAARFANWLSNGQGSGDTELGVYTFDGPRSVSAITRDLSDPSQVFLPSEDEWYKAAFHDASAGTAGDYFLYAIGTDSVPVSDRPTDDPGAVNYWNDDGIENGFNDGPAMVLPGEDWRVAETLTDVGAYYDAMSAYGAFDMNGNVEEWTETVIGTRRALRGGSWGIGEVGLRSTYRILSDPSATVDAWLRGFRVASPVPSPAGLMVFVACAAMNTRRNRTHQ